MYTYAYFAQAYGQTTYGQCEYGTENTQCLQGANPGGGASGTDGGGLANTGIWLILALSVAALIIFIALIVRFWRRKPTAKEQTGPTVQPPVDTSDS